MTKKSLFFLSLIAALLIGAYALADSDSRAVPEWIQTEERLVGENSTQYADTLNRPVKTLWNNFLVEHDTDGYHNYSALVSNMDIDMSSKLDVSTFQIEHNADGTHSLTAADVGAGTAADVSTLQSEVSGLQTAVSNAQADASAAGALATLNETSISTVNTKATSAQSDVDALEVDFLTEHNADGSHNLPPSGGIFAIERSAHGLPFVSYSMTDFSLIGSADLQVVVVAKPVNLSVAEELIGVKNDVYACNRLVFGKDSTDHLFVTIGTDLYDDALSSILCTEATYTSTQALPVDGLWHEYAVQINSAGIVFYVDGTAEAGQVLSAPLDIQAYALETLTIGSGFAGGIASAKIGTELFWPTAGSKGISQEGLLYPGKKVLFALNEGTGATVKEYVSGSELNIASDVSWVALPGLF